MTHLKKNTTPTNESAEIDRSALITAVPHLRAFARLLKGDPAAADILAQEVIVHARAMSHRFQPGNGLKLWLFALAHRLHQRDLQKAGARHDARIGAGTAAPGLSCQVASYPSPEFGLAFSQLRDEEREALILIEAASLSYAEAASVSNCSAETIKNRVSRARARLLQTPVVGTARAMMFGSANEIFI